MTHDMSTMATLIRSSAALASACGKKLAQPTAVIPREGGGSSTPRLIHFIADVSGNTGSSAGTCHRARHGRDPVADDDSWGCDVVRAWKQTRVVDEIAALARSGRDDARGVSGRLGRRYRSDR